MPFPKPLFKKNTVEEPAEFARGVINALLLSLLFFIVVLLWLLL